jgi:hypothetical protein
LYQNDSGNFTEVPTALPTVVDGRVSWGDYDNDGDLDLLVGGARLYRNDLNTINTLPSPPTSLLASVLSNAVHFSWLPSTDGNQTSGLTYNLNVRKAVGRMNVTASMSDLSNGRRRLPQLANPAIGWTLYNLPPGAYYWSVQTIDHSFASSEFAAEQYFVIGAPWIASIGKRADGLFEIKLGGQVGQTYTLEATSDFSLWTPLRITNVTDGLVRIIDETEPRVGVRFYRARTTP